MEKTNLFSTCALNCFDPRPTRIYFEKEQSELVYLFVTPSPSQELQLFLIASPFVHSSNQTF